MSEWHLVRVARSWRLPLVEEALRGSLDDVLTLYRLDPGSMVRRPLFQTPYLFAAWDRANYLLWHLVRWQPGVVEIVGGAKPAIISEYEVENWRRLANDKGVINAKKIAEHIGYDQGEDSGLEQGDIVSFDFGAFDTKTGIFQEEIGKDALVEITLLGRQVIVYVPLTRVSLVPEEISEKSAPYERPHSIWRGGRRGSPSRQRQRLLPAV